MKRALALFGVLVLALLPVAARAQEPAASELEFVQKLRAKGYADLAKEYLDLLAKRGDPLITTMLPLEQARTLVALAREKDPGQRFALFAAARGQLEQFIKANAGKLEAAQATVELARLSAYHGQALLTRALREEEPAKQHEAAREAETMFQQAGKDLDAAIKTVQGALANTKSQDPKAEDVRKQLERDLQQARFDRGINYIDQARTYIDLSSDAANRKRAEIIQEAKKVFLELANDESTGVGALANAWLMKVSMEETDPQTTLKYYRRVMSQEGKEATPAKRWAKLFWMQNLVKDPTYGKLSQLQKLQLIEKEGKAWLAAYPAAVKSPEGQAVLYELANAYHLQAEMADKGKATKATAPALFAQAQKYYAQLAQMEGDLSEKANQLNLALSFQLMDKKVAFRTFDDLFLKGLYERFKFREATAKLDKADGKEKEDLEKAAKRHLKEVVKALNRAVSLATARTPIQKLDDARFYLTGAYMVAGDLARAAVAGEALARSRPPTRRSPAGAAAAIDSYGALLARNPADPDPGTRARLQDLADFVLLPDNQKFWAADPVTDVAHYQLAMLLNKDDRLKDALAHLEQLRPAFPGYLYAQGQLVFIAQEAREKAKTAEEKKAYEQVARAALARMAWPDDPSRLDPSTAAMYFFAQMELGKLLYADAGQALAQAGTDKTALDRASKLYGEMAAALKALADRYQKLPVKLTEQTQDRLKFSLGVLQKYADLGQADVEFRRAAGDKAAYDKVLASTKAVVDRVAADAAKVKGGGPLRYKDYQVTGEVLGLALRAHVQKGDIEKGKQLLALLKRLRGTEDNQFDVASGNVVKNLLREINAQVDHMKKNNETAKLKEVVGNFSVFLDEIGKEYQTKGVDPETATMLGRAYNSLGEPCKAAAVYAKVPAPAFLDEKRKFEPAEEEQLGSYWYFQVQYAEALRLCGQDYKEADKVITRILTHPNGKNQILAQVEKNLLLEDQGYYGPAFKQWQAFMNNPSLKRELTNRAAQKLYFNGYFYAYRTLYKYATKDPAVKDRKRFIRAVASQILKLEHANSPEGWEIAGPQFRELIAANEPLREEYDELKKNYKK